ncbi:hypothetical protein [Oceanobacillus sp. CFH 90083]|nr:hypothetical protein [Oceanobacillus sp. CFH 90083]
MKKRQRKNFGELKMNGKAAETMSFSCFTVHFYSLFADFLT